MAEPCVDLLALPPEALRRALAEHFRARGQPAYRASQVARWIFESRSSSLDAMSDLPRAEREALAAAFAVREPEAATVAKSRDRTVKHVWRFPDGELVESVLIPTDERLTLCISSQAGCAMGCTFCATGWGGFRRQLSAGEIVSQYRASRRWAEANGPVTRTELAGSHLVFALTAPAAMLALSGSVAGFIYGVSTGNAGGEAARVVSAALVQIPAVWVIAAVAMLLYGGIPRLTTMAWGVLIACLLLSQLGPILRLPQWAMNLSPFTHVPDFPVESLDWGPLVVLFVVACGLATLGLVRFRARDIPTV